MTSNQPQLGFDFVTAMHFYQMTLKRAAESGPKRYNEVRRKLAEGDLFFLLTNVLRRKDIIRPWLYDRCREVQADPDDHLDLWAREHYKAVDVHEPVPTPTGWKEHGSLKVGDWVYGSAGDVVKVIAKTEVFKDADCYRVSFDDGYSVVVSGNHLWQVEKRTRKREYRRAGQDRESIVMATKDMAAHDHRADNRLAIKIAPSVDMPEAILPIMPYTLGLWLGDGHSASGRITCGDMECFDWVRKDGYEIGVPPPSCPITRTIYGLSTMLHGTGLMNNKHIPIYFKRASTEQRLNLLRGLMDSDGHCNERGTATFVNKSETLARDVNELCASLGLKPRFRAHKDGVFHVSFQAYEDMNPFHLTRKAQRVKAGTAERKRFVISVDEVDSRPVSCIQVDSPDGLYLVGKNYCTTHNSTIITFGLTIFDIIADPEITIGIFSHTKSVARKFLKQIKEEFEQNKDLPLLWPEIFYDNPSKESPRWSIDGGIVVKRKGNPKEHTVEGHGLVDGQPTGAHFKMRIYDDVVVPESVSTPDQIQKTTESWQMSDNLGSDGGRVRYIGTRYHLFDTYSVMLDSLVVTPRIHAATHNGKETGRPVLLSQEYLDKKRQNQGPYVFSSQMLLNPVADTAMGFNQNWIVTSDTEENAAMNSLWRFIIVDPAGGKQRRNNDYTTMWVIGYGADERYRVLDIRRDRMKLSTRCDTLLELHRKWKPGLVAYEEYGMQGDIEHIQFVQKQLLYEFDITPLGGSMKKELRILRLVPLFENGFKSVEDGGDGVPKSRIVLPTTCLMKDHEGRMRDLVKDFIEEEFVAFPVLKHDDMLDGLARIVDLEMKSLIQKPSATPAQERSVRVEEGLRRMGNKGNDSWITA